MKKPITIILAEDEALTSLAMKKQLERRGYEILSVVSSGKEAIESAISLQPDVMIMDINLPGNVNGIRAVQEIRKENTDVAVIFMTGYKDEEIKQEAMKLGPLAYLIKPVRVKQIIDIIDRNFRDS